MEQLEEELTCPICCGLFEDPRVLLCSHSFCRKCLEGLLEGTRAPSYRAPLKCPTCRKETPQNGACSLQVNYSLRGIVEKYGKIRVLPKVRLCEAHPEQPLNIFCLTDVKLICGFCATTPDHKGHAFCSMEEAVDREKVALQDMIRGFECWQGEDIQSRLETLQAGKKRALQSVNSEAERVAEYFDKLIGSLEGKKSEILGDFETMKLVVMQTYDPEISGLSAALQEQMRAASVAESGDDPLCFLQRMQELRHKLKATPLKPRDPTELTPLLRNFDLRKWDSLRLDEVDKMAIPPERKRSAGGRVRVFCATVLFSLAIFFMFQAHLNTSAIGDLYSQLPRADALRRAAADVCARLGVNLRHLTDLCSPLPGAFLKYLGDSLDMAVDFIGRCRFEFNKFHS
ncbi:tripartite motif-containing 13 [Synchiropus splendidus]|uniref:tripartite motif-containing 13 n=1 Tax=Synchiropus splendidus TaxID=270530 RepID=UPI00237DC574|nr:tripartite motif-containing 13 [Synchiropus splendidus]